MTSDFRAPLQTLIEKWRARAEWARGQMTANAGTIHAVAFEAVWFESARIADDLDSLLSALIAEGPSQQEKEKGDTRVDEPGTTVLDQHDMWFFNLLFSPRWALTNSPLESDSRWQQWKQIRAELAAPRSAPATAEEPKN